MSELAELQKFLAERFDRIDSRIEALTEKVKAASASINHQASKREEGDEKLGRSLDRIKSELDAVSRAQGVQATKVIAICEKLGIRPSLHDASEPPQAAGSAAGQ